MSLRGRAFLTMWWEVAEGSEREFDRWHTIEHMPERLGVPGFLRGRRYRHVRKDRGVFQLYEAAHIETFRSPAYMARLNAPTDWSNRVQPGLTNLVRGACQTLISLGEGVGGCLLTVRCGVGDADRIEADHALAATAPAIARLHGVTAVHVGRHQPEITKLETAETRLRPAAAPPEFDFVLLVEGIGASELDAATATVLELAKIPGQRPSATDVYRLDYLLNNDG
jgi:hypothetical protein